MLREPLSPKSAVFLLVDHQTGVFERVVEAPPREQVEANVLRLARAAVTAGYPYHPHNQRGGVRERRAASSTRADPARGIREPHRPPRDHRFPGRSRRGGGAPGHRTAPARNGRDRHRGVRRGARAPRLARGLPGRLRRRRLRICNSDGTRHFAAAARAARRHRDHHRLGERRARRRVPQTRPDHARMSQPQQPV